MLTQSRKFTGEEIKHVESSIEELNDQIRNERKKLDLTVEQTKWLTDQFDELKSLASHTTKRQWKHTLVGIVAGLSMQVAYNPERTNAIFALIGKALDWLIQTSYYLPAG